MLQFVLKCCLQTFLPCLCSMLPMVLFKIILFFTNVSKNTLILGSSQMELKARIGMGCGRREKKKYRLWCRSRVHIPAAYLPPRVFSGRLPNLSEPQCLHLSHVRIKGRDVVKPLSTMATAGGVLGEWSSCSQCIGFLWLALTHLGPGSFSGSLGPIPCFLAGQNSRYLQENRPPQSQRPQGKEGPDSCLLMHSCVSPLEPGSPPECLHLIPVARFEAYFLLALP